MTRPSYDGLLLIVQRSHELCLTMAACTLLMLCMSLLFLYVSGVDGGFVLGCLFTISNGVVGLRAWRRKRRALVALQIVYGARPPFGR